MFWDEDFQHYPQEMRGDPVAKESKHTKVLSVVAAAACLFLSLGSAWADDRLKGNAEGAVILFSGSLPDVVGTPERGGLAYLAAMVRAYREAYPDAVFVHGGGGFGPSVLAQYDKGVHIIDLLNDVDPDAYMVSQRDFAYGDDEFILRTRETIFPLVSSNLLDTSTGEPIPGLIESLLLELPQLTVGLVGATTTRLDEIYLVDNTIVTDSASAVAREAANLRAQGADFIIALVERSDTEFENAESLDLGVDLFVSGAESGNRIMEAEHATWVEAEVDMGSAIIISVKPEGERMALDIEWDYQANYGRDPDMLVRVEGYADRFRRLLNLPIVRTDVDLDSRQSTLLFQETAFTNLLADVLREEGEADAAFYNGGMIRGQTQYPAGSMLTRRDIQSELPFSNQLVVLDVTGAQLLAALEHGLARMGGGWGEFPHVSNMSMDVDANAEVGMRVSDLRIDGQTVDLSGTYSLATTSYLANGGDGYVMFTQASRRYEDTSFTLFERILANLQSRESIAPRVEGRMVIEP